MSDQGLPPPPPPPRDQNVTPPMYGTSPSAAAAQGSVGQVRAYEPGAVKSQGGGCFSKGVVGVLIAIVLTIVVGSVVGGIWIYFKAKEGVEEIKDAVEEVLVHPDCALLRDGERVPDEFVVDGSLDLTCGSGTNMSLSVTLDCVSSGRRYAQNTRGYAFLDDLVYRSGVTVPC